MPRAGPRELHSDAWSSAVLIDAAGAIACPGAPAEIFETITEDPLVPPSYRVEVRKHLASHAAGGRPDLNASEFSRRPTREPSSPGSRLAW